MEKYKILGIKKRTSKKGTEYFLCYLSLETDNSFDLINVMVEEKQVQPLLKTLGDSSFDVSKFLTLKYDTYNKRYNLVLTYGL